MVVRNNHNLSRRNVVVLGTMLLAALQGFAVAQISGTACHVLPQRGLVVSGMVEHILGPVELEVASVEWISTPSGPQAILIGKCQDEVVRGGTPKDLFVAWFRANEAFDEETDSLGFEIQVLPSLINEGSATIEYAAVGEVVYVAVLSNQRLALARVEPGTVGYIKWDFERNDETSLGSVCSQMSIDGLPGDIKYLRLHALVASGDALVLAVGCGPIGHIFTRVFQADGEVDTDFGKNGFVSIVNGRSQIGEWTDIQGVITSVWSVEPGIDGDVRIAFDAAATDMAGVISQDLVIDEYGALYITDHVFLTDLERPQIRTATLEILRYVERLSAVNALSGEHLPEYTYDLINTLRWTKLP